MDVEDKTTYTLFWLKDLRRKIFGLLIVSGCGPTLAYLAHCSSGLAMSDFSAEELKEALKNIDPTPGDIEQAKRNLRRSNCDADKETVSLYLAMRNLNVKHIKADDLQKNNKKVRVAR